jgi:hypothetical protein
LLENFRPLIRVEVFETFTLLITGLLVGEAKHGTVRSSVFAPANYQPPRISDFFTTHRVSPQKLMAKLTEIVLRLRYGGALPERMFWIADSTHTEKPHAEKIASLGLFHRTKRVVGRAKHLKATVMFAPRISISISTREGKSIGRACCAARCFMLKAGAFRPWLAPSRRKKTYEQKC